MTKTHQTPQGGSLKVTQTGSPIRREDYQAECLRALGLGRIGRSRVLQDNAIVQGLITKVHHLVRVEPCAESK